MATNAVNGRPRVVIAEDDAILRYTVKLIVQEHYDVVGEARCFRVQWPALPFPPAGSLPAWHFGQSAKPACPSAYLQVEHARRSRLHRIIRHGSSEWGGVAKAVVLHKSSPSLRSKTNVDQVPENSSTFREVSARSDVHLLLYQI